MALHDRIVLRVTFLFSRERVKKAIIKRVVELGKKQGLEVLTGGILSRANPDFWVYVGENRHIYCRIKDYVHPDDIELFRTGNRGKKLVVFAIREARPLTREEARRQHVEIYPGHNPQGVVQNLIKIVERAREVEGI